MIAIQINLQEHLLSRYYLLNKSYLIQPPFPSLEIDS